MVEYKIVFTKQAEKDKIMIKNAKLEEKAKDLIKVIENNPFTEMPPYEKLRGNFIGLYSRRINYQNRLVYQVYEEEHIIKIIRMWTHYEKI